MLRSAAQPKATGDDLPGELPEIDDTYDLKGKADASGTVLHCRGTWSKASAPGRQTPPETRLRATLETCTHDHLSVGSSRRNL
jgi:hypothetical protein